MIYTPSNGFYLWSTVFIIFQRKPEDQMVARLKNIYCEPSVSSLTSVVIDLAIKKGISWKPLPGVNAPLVSQILVTNILENNFIKFLGIDFTENGLQVGHIAEIDKIFLTLCIVALYWYYSFAVCKRACIEACHWKGGSSFTRWRCRMACRVKCVVRG